MSVEGLSWELALLARAWEGLHGHTATEPLAAESAELSAAYEHCRQLTAVHSRTFYLAARQLPEDKRRAVHALYAFCRLSDDTVDEGTGDRRQALAAWRRKILAPRPPAGDPVALAWADARAQFRVPARYGEQLMDGVARDLDGARYETFEDLASYCYGVASTVGLMAMHIIGFKGSEAVPYAVKLGVALQLTNILRDVGEDWRNGRLYLPRQELAAFGLSEADIDAGVMDERWHGFMRFQLARTRHLYQQAMPGVALLDPDGRFAIAAAAELYRGILDDIEAHDYDVFRRRAHVGTLGKLRRLPGIWWRARRDRE